MKTCFIVIKRRKNKTFRERRLLLNFTFFGQQCICHQLSSVAQSSLTLCDPMDRSTPGLPVQIVSLCSDFVIINSLESISNQQELMLQQEFSFSDPIKDTRNHPTNITPVLLFLHLPKECI